MIYLDVTVRRGLVKPGGDSMSNWIAAITATATLALAIATFLMSKQAKKAAVASENSVKQAGEELDLLKVQTRALQTQTELAEKTLLRDLTPILIPESPDQLVTGHVSGTKTEFQSVRLQFDGEMISHPFEAHGGFITRKGQFLWVAVEMKNVGAGPAIVSEETVNLNENGIGAQIGSPYVQEFQDVPISRRLLPQTPVIPSGEATYYVLRIEDVEGRVGIGLYTAGPQNSIRITYQDLTRTITYETSFNFSVSRDRLVVRPPTFEGFGISQRGPEQ